MSDVMGYDGMWGFGAIFMILFWVFVIAAAVWLVTTVTRQRETGGGGVGGQTALDILEERLARGELDLEEFRSRKAALTGPRR